MIDVQNFLESTHKQFSYYKSLGDKTFAQLAPADIHWQFNPESNSIAITVGHIWGNMMSRWTDFLSSDGEKEWRNRDGEFEPMIENMEQLQEKWEAGWACLFAALESVTDENIDQLVYIRNIGHTIPEAIHRQMAHYAYHIGQIVFVGRMIKGAAWRSLTIPKGGSEAYNAARFAEEKHRGHFTDTLKDADTTS